MGSAEAATKSPPLLRHLLALDASLSYALHAFFKPFLPAFFLLLLEYSADFRFSFPVSLAIVLASPSRLPLLLPFLLSLLLDLALIGLVKLIFRRARPHYNPNMSAVVHADNFSFPSGHASRVLLLATLMHLVFKSEDGLVPNFVDQWIRADSALLGIWVWAVLTATSRVLLGRHFLLDVLAGAFVGVLEGVFSFHFLRF
ncbi:hypothetical protein SLEP1_g46024 [Rubroshorea leprosula]|uniref:Phosphatidic acid phosphatase type 2/haloperoxidase domain-containing protein n=1 Tax=Rubroshorea leprosula TaxID=152421 RepID=A0AAV5LKW9_9ROSI|nr:hypothetical protein SLEP1_g46024 [Rubroshorea leprosula]